MPTPTRPLRAARAAALLLWAAVAAALPATAPAAEDPAAEDPAPASTPAAVDAPGWVWQPSLLLYVLPGEPAYFQPTLAVDHGGLHLEARYNYEARQTGSAWVGWNFTFGESLQVGLTPMVGGVFGQLRGVAPGLTATLDWGPVSFWSQGEWVFDLQDAWASYFYVWSELAITGPDWLRVGLVLQRTRAFQTATEVQGGPLLGISLWQLSATVYLFAPGQVDQFVVVAASGTF